jgi:hypothetical protein
MRSAARYRSHQRLGRHACAISGEQLSICLLSDEEVGRLVHYGIEPCHAAHRHLTLKQALRKLATGQIEELEHNGCYYARPVKLYVLAPRTSGYIPVMQRILGAPPKHITPPVFSELEPMPG